MAERTCHVCLKKITHSVNFNNLNCWGIVKSVYVDILCSKGRTDRFLLQKWIPDVFIDFRPTLLCPSPGHNNGVSILSTINFRTKNLKDLRLGKVDKLLISYIITNSWLFWSSGFDFIFSLRDSENQQFNHIPNWGFSSTNHDNNLLVQNNKEEEMTSCMLSDKTFSKSRYCFSIVLPGCWDFGWSWPMQKN